MSPAGWKYFLHPDGTPYFVNAEKHVVTPDNVADEVILGNLEDTIGSVMDYGIRLSEDCELWVRHDNDGRGKMEMETTPYVMDHSKRAVRYIILEHEAKAGNTNPTLLVNIQQR